MKKDYSKEFVKEGKRDDQFSPLFSNAEKAIDWLNNPNRKYVSSLQNILANYKRKS